MPRVATAHLYAALLALTAAAYLPLWENDFVDFDDELYITRNPGVVGGLTGPGFCWAWTNDEAPYRMPVTWLSLQLDAQCFSARDLQGQAVPSPAAFHGQNLFWHGAGVLLLFALWRRLLGGRWRAFLVAALFAVHPMHVESVAWAVERKDVLSGFFGTLTLWAYVGYLRDPGRKRYAGLAGAFLLSLLAKPMLITLPFVLLLLDYWPLRRLWPAGPVPGGAARAPVPPGRLVLEKVPLFALALGAAVLTAADRDRHGALVSWHDLPPSDRVANALTGYGWYLSHTFYPARLAVLYPHPLRDWSAAPALAGASALLAVTGLSVWQARRRPWLVTGWLWFAVTLLPVIGLAQGGWQAWADRFSYWPHVGLFAAVVCALGEAVGRLRLPGWVPGVAGALALGCLGVLTWVQVGYWRDAPTLWEHAVAVTGDNARAHEHLSRCYRRAGRLEEAASHLAEAARIQLGRLRGAPGAAGHRPAAGEVPPALAGR